MTRPSTNAASEEYLSELLANTAWVRRLASRLAVNSHEAEDLVQETWRVALESTPEPGRPLRAWLGGVLQNLSAKASRARYRRATRETAAARSESLPATADLVARAAAQRALVGFVMNLEEPYRTAILLRYLEELPPRAIAERLKTPIRTVNTRLARGLALLRERLDSDCGAGQSWLPSVLAIASDRPRVSAFTTGVLGMKIQYQVLLACTCLAAIAGLMWDRIGLQPAGQTVVMDQVGDLGEPAPAGAETSHAGEVSSRVLVGPSAIVPRPQVLGAIDMGRDLHGQVTDEAGVGIGGARLSVLSCVYRQFPGSTIRADDRSRDLVAEGVSDQQGRFQIRLDPGRRLDLQVQCDGYATETLINLYSGESLHIILRSPGTLEGSITGSKKSIPIEGARVVIVGVGVSDTGKVKYTAFTNHTGRYELRGLPKGFYEMQVYSPSGESEAPGQFEMKAGARVFIDVELERRAVVSGRVASALTGDPIEGAVVASDPWMLRGVRTDAKGEFELVRDRRYYSQGIYVVAEGFGRWERQLIGRSDEDLVLDFDLLPARRARGCVIGPDGKPESGVEVMAIANVRAEMILRNDWCRAVTGVDGTFELVNLRPDIVHFLTISKDGFGTAIFNFPEEELSVPVLELGSLPLLPAAFIGGVLIDTSGDPVPELRVSLEIWPDTLDALRSQPLEDGPYASIYRQFGTRTDARGRFIFPDLPPGSFRLAVSIKGVATTAELDVTLSEGMVRDDIVLRINLEGSIDGRLTDSKGEPVRFGMVTAAEPGGHGPWAGHSLTTAFTDTEGRFSLRGLGEGAVDLYGREPLGEGFSGDPGQQRRFADAVLLQVQIGSAGIQLVLPVGHVVEGVVLGADDEVVRNYWVTTRGLVIDMTVPPGEDGRFRIQAPLGTAFELEFSGPAIEASGSGSVITWEDGTARQLVHPVSAGEREIEIRLVPPR